MTAEHAADTPVEEFPTLPIGTDPRPGGRKYGQTLSVELARGGEALPPLVAFEPFEMSQHDFRLLEAPPQAQVYSDALRGVLVTALVGFGVKVVLALSNNKPIAWSKEELWIIGIAAGWLVVLRLWSKCKNRGNTEREQLVKLIDEHFRTRPMHRITVDSRSRGAR